MELVKDGRAIPIAVEECAFEGVKRVAGMVAKDIEKVTRMLPEVVEISAKDVVPAKTGWERESEVASPWTGTNRQKRAATFFSENGSMIFCATLEHSPFLEYLEEKEFMDFSEIRGKREVYGIRLVEVPAVTCEILLICGSDKRGTIYGMFALSEYIGVSPLCFWGDVTPVRREALSIEKNIEIVSKEPSVRYRGFFINDEWPCFGTWTNQHFGGFNADMYEHVFELLLRLKGNYLWPAMWSASFPLDGPGSGNEELADIYGVIMGYSHHEPCLRASEEWDKVRGVDSPYGNAWNYATNREGLLRYWKDGLRRSGNYENIITIGMRGERDSIMLGEDASLKDNIDILKDIITQQRRLIRENDTSHLDGAQKRQLLALYKEVETYFYGDEDTPGLRDWDELDDVIFMLCEDNFGNMRTLPGQEWRAHAGGYGMYYHFDYHGGPVSYEWVDSTPLWKTWEQMTMAYEYGVREVWIVNVGDLKFHEVPLSYFLSMAYDYDRWGISNPDSYNEYIAEWVAKTFSRTASSMEKNAAHLDDAMEMPLRCAQRQVASSITGNAAHLDDAVEMPLRCAQRQVASSITGNAAHLDDAQKKIAEVFTEYININHLRRPESLHPGIYHSCHYGESDRMLARAKRVELLVGELASELGDQEETAFYSMIGYPAMASMNLLKMHLYAGKNEHYAAQGRPVANHYADLAAECMRRDRAFDDEFGQFLDGKWDGMQMAAHIGFTKWNEDGWRYPVLQHVEPVQKPRMSVSRKDEEQIYDKIYGSPMIIQVPDFLDEGCESVTLEIANDGCGRVHYQIVPENPAPGIPENAFSGEDVCSLPDWLDISPVEGDVELLEEIILRCDRSLLPEKEQTVRLLIKDGETTVAVEVKGGNKEKAEETFDIGDVFMPQRGVICIHADHFARKADCEKTRSAANLDGATAGHFTILEGYGKYGVGVRVLPVTASFPEPVIQTEPDAIVRQGTAELADSAESPVKPPVAEGKYVKRFVTEENSVERPTLTYRFWAEKSGRYRVTLLTAPSNSVVKGKEVSLILSNSRGECVRTVLVPEDFRAGESADLRWSSGVLNQIHETTVEMNFEEGVQELTIGAVEAGVILERILICEAGTERRSSYLGPLESRRMNEEKSYLPSETG